MIVFKKLNIQGFKCFSKKQTIDFGAGDFVFITGSNLVNESIGSNGAGKSSILDALCWVLFGKTAKNLIAGDVKNWTSKEKCIISVELLINNDEVLLTRKWNPNKILLETNGVEKEVTQNEIDLLLNVNFEIFLYSVLFGQTNTMFFDLGKTDRANIFSKVLDIDYWLGLSEKSKNKHTSLVEDCRLAENKINVLKKELETLNSMNLDKEFLEWEKEKENDILSMNKEKIDIDQKIANIISTVVEEEKGCEDLSKKIKRLERRIGTLQKVLDDHKNELQVINVNVMKAEVCIRDINTKLDRLSSMGGVECEVCLQHVNIDHVDKHSSSLEKEKAKKLEEIEDLNKLKSEHNSEISKIDIKALNGELIGLNKAQNDITSSITISKSKIKTLSSDIDKIDRNIKTLNTKENPFLEKIKNIEDKKVKISKELEAQQLKLTSTTKTMESVKFWITGFKEIRLDLIKSAIDEYEVEVNNVLDLLGLSGWYVKFDVDKETKSKSVQKGFHVMVYGPNNETPVKWESWSGGESQRLKLAGSMALSNMISNISGFRTNIEFWDEPTKGLNSTKGLLAVLSERQKNTNKSIWLIDHHSMDYGNFDRVLSVVKNKDGSKIEVLR